MVERKLINVYSIKWKYTMPSIAKDTSKSLSKSAKRWIGFET